MTAYKLFNLTQFILHIINEILPFVTETHNIHISQDPAKRCMCGQSSAAVASLYTCWHRPDKFGLALLTSTSFGNTQKKPNNKFQQQRVQQIFVQYLSATQQKLLKKKI